jgi:hypothetical protein
MTFKDKIRTGRPSCMDCIYFDKRLLRVVGSSLVGATQGAKQLAQAEGTGNAGICRIDPPGPAALGGWIVVNDGVQTYCSKWDDGGDVK